MSLVQIKHRFTAAVLFEGEYDSRKACLEAAVKAGAYLAGAYLTDANLAGADLTDANLARANLTDAYLAGADLAGAKNVGETNGSEVKQSEPADRAERQRLRAQRYREQHPEVPVVEALDAKLLSILESGKGKLKMSTWHTCRTTHCRAGWAITLAGDAGKVLEEKYGPQRAGTLIYRASTGHVPHFFATDERALEDIREQAALQVQAS